MNTECVLCIEDSKFFGLTECNHGPFCFRCVYKMRVISKNNSCPICKAESRQIVISQEFKDFKDLQKDIIPDKTYSDVFHDGPQARQEFGKLMEFKCFVKINGHPCKNEKSFPNIAFLKKHLKEDHKRVLCDVCLEKKTCVLEEQKLYTQGQLNRHLERGDIDEYGNVTFIHPYCGFCKRYFFNDDEFRLHLNMEHYTCNVCGQAEKYRFYKNYDSMETHYKISHYICSDPNCLAKKFIAFRSAEELKVHKAEIHGVGGKKIDGKQLCGFVYAGTESENALIQIKDHQGIDMQEQFLTLKKSKNRALCEADQQQDAIIDLRDFYPSHMEEDEHFKNAFVIKHKKNEDKIEKEDNANKNNKKKNYVSKDEFEKQKPQLARENQDFSLEQLSLIKTLHMSKLHYDDFQDKLSTFLGKDDLKNLEGWRNKFNKRHLKAEVFIQNFLDMMKKVSLKAGYEIFPHYIRTVNNEHAKAELDQEFSRFLKKIPMKNKCLLSRCQTYGDLFRALLKEIQKNLEQRIVTQKLSIKKPIVREKERLFQIMGVLRRLKIQEMGRFKFAGNFGVEIDTTELIHEKVFKIKQQKIQQKLSQIPVVQFIDLYVFVNYSLQAICHNENMHLAKNKIHQRIIEDFLFDRPHLEEQFGPKKSQMKTLDEQVEYEKLEEQRNYSKKLKQMEKKNENMGYHSKADFNLNDKGDFPDLLQGQKKNEDSQKVSNFRDVIENAKSKPATYQKSINEMFPSIGEESSTKEEAQVSKGEKKEKAWWEKLNEKKIDIQEEEQQVKVRKGKNNKQQKWVSVKGFFN